uniref:Uncharacterized protein n=1 Tax=Pseudictyota dubia TaxID=2749911 RepID=A0A7R9Z9W3_9STRA|mmetsp:Transcript_32929/g.60681  ORF Transcript_32929/g.60681 Transcript_32929/m.60681 type:complete len:240 (+) Transcript_32929:218-937(+)|eukprot:CAMPEP_0197464588 /NCGR_PEP_ID=MMETSP1175-20131217/64097_1 /TAXON_ID=1003142 /ORGANISM="Triceratium dubium, Strain CCMP147" /LENGTH=239 /DNA_ID=CAMNT_0043000569 /DNA_START=604 /DNA_END=1323 /DNA_ORIENTATION=+
MFRSHDENIAPQEDKSNHPASPEQMQSRSETMILPSTTGGRRISSFDSSIAAVNELKAECYDEVELRKGEKSVDTDAIEEHQDEEGSRRTMWKKNMDQHRLRSSGHQVLDDSFAGLAVSSFRVSSGPSAAPMPASTSLEKGLPRMRGRCRNGTPSDVFGWIGSFSALDDPDSTAGREKDVKHQQENSGREDTLDKEQMGVRGGGASRCTARMRGRTRNGTPSALFGWEGSFTSATSLSG